MNSKIRLILLLQYVCLDQFYFSSGLLFGCVFQLQAIDLQASGLRHQLDQNALEIDERRLENQENIARFSREHEVGHKQALCVFLTYEIV